ncbi:MAG: hypothetical protein GY816_12310 [Cytophagales bacterium]|nr:hypothetical protein [Cytophagales bacterium]
MATSHFTFKESKDAEGWGSTSFEDPEFWGTITSSKDAETWRTTSFKVPGS